MQTPQSALIEEVRAFDDRRVAAMLAGDIAALDELLDEQMTYMHSSGVVDDKKGYIEGVRDKIWEYKQVARENMKIAVSGPTATIFCHLMIDLQVKGEPRKVDSNALAVWTKGSGTWKLLAVLSAARSK